MLGYENLVNQSVYNLVNEEGEKGPSSSTHEKYGRENSQGGGCIAVEVK